LLTLAREYVAEADEGVGRRPGARPTGSRGPASTYAWRVDHPLKKETPGLSAEERPRFRGRVAGLFYVFNIVSGSLAPAFIRRMLALYADLANLTATVSYVVVTLLLYSNSLRLATAPVNALVFFGVYCLLIGYLISKATFLPRVLGIVMVIGGLGWLTFLWPSLANALTPFNMAPGILAETMLTLWLLVPDVDAQRWKEQAATARLTIPPEAIRNPQD
jgi:hypothetical protein